MGRLDDLINKTPEDFKTLTVRVDSDTAEDLKAKASKLGVSRTKLVREMFLSGMEMFNEKFDVD